MKKCIVIIILINTGLFSCGKAQHSKTGTIEKEPLEAFENITTREQLNPSKDYNKYIDTRFEYIDSNGKSLIIENSLPKGGLNYTDHNGNDYVYAIFWTQIINETENPFEFKLDFSNDKYELPASPDNYFKIVLPPEKMFFENLALFDYGLSNLKVIIDQNIRNPQKFHKTINSKETSIFYVISLFKKGVEGKIRTGLRLKDNKLYYRVNDIEVYCGTYDSKNLKLKQ